MRKQDQPLTITLELELPADRIFACEVDLLQAYLAELLQQAMLESGEDEGEPR